MRPHCAHCLRPQSACICRWVTPVTLPLEVLILQHPLEVANPKGSARLLHMSLPHSRMVTGEQFDPVLLQTLLTAPFDGAPPAPAKRALLLYPESAAGAASEGPEGFAPATQTPHTTLASSLAQDLAGLRLIVLDGTWRKSRKMLYANPLLQQLPRLSLHGLPASRYRVRKAHKPDQLSTLEAVCAALVQLMGAGGAQRIEPLLLAFDGLVAQLEQARHSPPITAPVASSNKAL